MSSFLPPTGQEPPQWVLCQETAHLTSALYEISVEMPCRVSFDCIYINYQEQESTARRLGRETRRVNPQSEAPPTYRTISFHLGASKQILPVTRTKR